MTAHEQEPAEGADGLYLYGVVRSRHRRRRDLAGVSPLTRVRFRDLEALVRPAPYAVPALDDILIQDHQRVADSVMRRTTILPTPFGLIFHGRRAVLRFLEDQYIVLDEGLAFLENHFELRLHILGDDDMGDLRSMAAQLYSDLRRIARAALPLPTGEGKLLSAAFLVERGGWIRFVEHTEDLNQAHPELIFDLTGPWPAYDFVKVLR